MLFRHRYSAIDFSLYLALSGPFGINHGVEQHIDVVEYSRERLEHFKKTCEAFDEFEFCEPQFVVRQFDLLPSTNEVAGR